MRSHEGLTSPHGTLAVLPQAVEFPSQRRERIDWHKLASVDLHDLISSCSIDILQDNLSHVAFCNAEDEFDLSITSGQRNLVKMFRLAQLIIQYLFLSQDFIETQLKESQEQVALITDKHQQIKIKFLQQVEEAKKLRTSNRNMRETVKYVHSFALDNGIFQALRCPLCPKTFRSFDYLQSHLWRKHPEQANTVTIPSANHIQSNTVPSSCTLGASVATDTRELGTVGAVGPDGLGIPNNTRDIGLPQKNTENKSDPSVASPKTNDIDYYRLNEIERKFDALNNNFSRIIQEMEEQRRVLERDTETKQEEVRRAWEEKADLEKGYEGQLAKLSEQLAYLHSNLHSKSDNVKLDEIKRQQDELKSLHREMERENQVKNHSSQVKDISKLDEIDGLMNEIRSMKKLLREQKQQHKNELMEMRESLQRDYENAISTERERLDLMIADREEDMISNKPPPSPSSKNINKTKRKQIDFDIQVTPGKNKPQSNKKQINSDIQSTSGKNGQSNTKQMQPNMQITPGKNRPQSNKKQRESDIITPSSPPQLDEFKSRPLNGNSSNYFSDRSNRDNLNHRGSMESDMKRMDTISDTESESDTSYWNQGDLKVTHLKIASQNLDKNSITDREEQGSQSPRHYTENEPFEGSTSEDFESASESETIQTSDSFSLETLLRENPKLWTQMRDTTAEVLASKLAALGIGKEKGIKTDIFNACLSKLRKDRRSLENKHENFLDLRKKLDKEVRAKVEEKFEFNNESFETQSVTPKHKKQRSMFGRMLKNVKNVQSRVKERSKSLKSSVTSDILKPVKSGEVQVIGRLGDEMQVKDRLGDEMQASIGRSNRRVSVASRKTEDESEISSTESEEIVHKETSKSVTRSLFGPNKLKYGSYFENKTYGQETGKGSVQESSESEWDSDHSAEYENLKAKPPVRYDSLNISQEPVDHHASQWDSWDAEKPIKLKKPEGKNVSSLARSIESQLNNRSINKPAGAIDLANSIDNIPGSSQNSPVQRKPNVQTVNSPSESLNTIRSSMWGSSAEDLNRDMDKIEEVKKSRTSKLSNWDSGDDLNISDLE